MRSLLKAFAFVSTTLFTLLQAGILLNLSTGIAAASPTITARAKCLNCCSCIQQATCKYTGAGRTCRRFACTCTCSIGRSGPLCN
jgi:hypothetical protein